MKISQSLTYWRSLKNTAVKFKLMRQKFKNKARKSQTKILPYNNSKPKLYVEMQQFLTFKRPLKKSKLNRIKTEIRSKLLRMTSKTMLKLSQLIWQESIVINPLLAILRLESEIMLTKSLITKQPSQ